MIILLARSRLVETQLLARSVAVERATLLPELSPPGDRRPASLP